MAFVFRSNTLVGPSGGPRFGSLPTYWVQALLLAVALQRRELAEIVLAVPTDVLKKVPGEIDACFIHLVHALQAFFEERDVQPHLEEFERLSRPESLKIATPRILERYRAVGPILVALRSGEASSVNDALVTQLKAHKAMFGKGKEAKNPTGLIDVHAVGLMRVALDRGMKLDVESDYVPKWLIGLEQS